MKRKRIPAFLMALTLCLALAAGCGDTGATETPAPSAEPGAAATQAPEPTAEAAEPASRFLDTPVQLPLTAEPVEMDYWVTLFNFLAAYGVDLKETTFFREMESRTGVVMNITAIPVMAAAEQFSIMYTSGDYPDLVESGMQFYAKGPDNAIENGIIVAFDDFIQDWMPNYWQALTYDSAYRIAAMSNGGHYYAAHTIISPLEGAPNGPVIRQDWLDALGLDRPVTYDEYHGVLAAFKAAGYSDGPLWLTANAFQRGSYLAAGYEVATYEASTENDPWVVRDGQVEFAAVSDGMLAYLTMLNAWWNEGLVYSDFMSGNDRVPFPTDAGLITGGKVGVVYVNRDDIASYTANAEDADFRLTPISDARQNADDTLHIRIRDNYVYEGTVITTGCENVELAARWLDYCYSEDGYILTNYGVEGEGLAYDAQGNPRYTDLVLHSDAYTIIAATAIYSKYQGSMILNGTRTFSGYSQDQLDSVDCWSRDDESLCYPLRAQMTADEGDRYNEIMGDIKVYVKECALKFIIGEMPLSDWDSYVEHIRSSGIDEAGAVKQAAYDRYMART